MVQLLGTQVGCWGLRCGCGSSSSCVRTLYSITCHCPSALPPKHPMHPPRVSKQQHCFPWPAIHPLASPFVALCRAASASVPCIRTFNDRVWFPVMFKSRLPAAFGGVLLLAATKTISPESPGPDSVLLAASEVELVSGGGCGYPLAAVSM